MPVELCEQACGCVYKEAGGQLSNPPLHPSTLLVYQSYITHTNHPQAVIWSIMSATSYIVILSLILATVDAKCHKNTDDCIPHIGEFWCEVSRIFHWMNIWFADDNWHDKHPEWRALTEIQIIYTNSLDFHRIIHDILLVKEQYFMEGFCHLYLQVMKRDWMLTPTRLRASK